MENKEQFESVFRKRIWEYVHEYCVAEAFVENFTPSVIMTAYHREFRYNLKYLGLRYADGIALRHIVYRYLFDRRGSVDDVRKKCHFRSNGFVTLDMKYFMPMSEFNEVLDKLIFTRKNCKPLGYF